MTSMPRVVCPVCGRRISVTAAGRVRYHNPPYKTDFGCPGSYRQAPPPEETDQ